MTWNYILDRGISNAENGINFFYGANRFEVRKDLNYSDPRNEGRFKDEDSYNYILQSEDNIRVDFDEMDELICIEVLEGIVEVKGVYIEVKGDLSKAILELNNIGFELKEGSYGYTCSELKFHIGDSAKNGGEDNYISWFHTGKDFDEHMDK